MEQLSVQRQLKVPLSLLGVVLVPVGNLLVQMVHLRVPVQMVSVDQMSELGLMYLECYLVLNIFLRQETCEMIDNHM